MSKIAIVSFGRKESTRCPNKMLRPFAGTTLTDIVLSKIMKFGRNAYFAGFESEFKEKCTNSGVNFIQRTKRSVTIDGPILDVFDFVKNIDNKKILFINPCVPFLSIKTIEEFLNRCQDNYERPALAVIERKNYFFDEIKHPLNFDPDSDNWNTKTVKKVFESANALYFFDKDYFLNNGFYWSWNAVDLVSFEPSYEFVDIDTEEDFIKAEMLWKVRNGK